MNTQSRSRQHGGTLIGLALGVVVGVLISFAVVWYLNKTPLPFVERVTKPETMAPTSEPRPLPGKPGDKPIAPGGERRFDFYEILEGKKEAAVPGAPVESATPAPVATPGAVATAVPPAPTLLQLGAFQQVGDAENLRARLAILGFEATIQAVDSADKGRLHRVRVGPFGTADELNRAREQLSQNGMPATVVRARE